MSNSSTTTVQRHLPTLEQAREAIAANRTAIAVMGIALMLTGIGALAVPFAGSLAIDIIVATAFIVSGSVYCAHAFAGRSWAGFAWELIVGLVYIGAGIILFVRPVDGVLVLTAVIGISLIADGIVRTGVSVAMRRGPWGWVLASGILSILLGFAVFAMPAGNAVLLIGVLVGINLFASGLAFLMLGIRAGDGHLESEQHEARTARPT